MHFRQLAHRAHRSCGPCRSKNVKLLACTAPCLTPCSFLINLLACPALLLGSTIPAAVHKALLRRRQRQLAAQHAAAAGGPSPHAQHPHAPLPGGTSTGSEAPPAKVRVPITDSALAEPLLGPEDLEQPQPAAPAAAAPSAPAAAEPTGQEGAASASKPDPALPRMATSPPEPSSPAAGRGAPDAPSAAPSWKRQAAVLAGTTFFLSSLLLAQVFSLLFTTVGALGIAAALFALQARPAPAECAQHPACNAACHWHK